MNVRRVKIDNIADVGSFYIKMVRNRNEIKYNKIIPIEEKDDDDILYVMYDCIYKDILNWLKPFLSRTFYENMMHHINECWYDKRLNKLKFRVHDFNNTIYDIQGEIEYIDNECIIRLNPSYKRIIPFLIKNRIINNIFDEIEQEILLNGNNI